MRGGESRTGASLLPRASLSSRAPMGVYMCWKSDSGEGATMRKSVRWKKLRCLSATSTGLSTVGKCKAVQVRTRQNFPKKHDACIFNNQRCRRVYVCAMRVKILLNEMSILPIQNKANIPVSTRPLRRLRRHREGSAFASDLEAQSHPQTQHPSSCAARRYPWTCPRPTQARDVSQASGCAAAPNTHFLLHAARRSPRTRTREFGSSSSWVVGRI